MVAVEERVLGDFRPSEDRLPGATSPVVTARTVPSEVHVIATSTRDSKRGNIEVDDQPLEQMRQADPDEPVVMLNLLKFRERALTGFGVDGMSGQEAFRRYGELNNAANVRYDSEPV